MSKSLMAALAKAMHHESGGLPMLRKFEVEAPHHWEPAAIEILIDTLASAAPNLPSLQWSRRDSGIKNIRRAYAALAVMLAQRERLYNRTLEELHPLPLAKEDCDPAVADAIWNHGMYKLQKVGPWVSEDLRDCKQVGRAVQATFDVGRCAEGLKTIELRFCDYEATPAERAAAGRAMLLLLRGVARGGTPNLQVFSLTHGSLGVDLPVFSALQEKGILPSLAHLILRDCGMDDNKVEVLASALLARHRHADGARDSLRRLTIAEDPEVGPRGCQALMSALQEGAAPELEGLDLSGTSVGDEGCRAVVSCIGAGRAACAWTLEDLDLSDCGLTAQSMDVWFEEVTMPLAFPALKTLDLGGSPLIGNQMSDLFCINLEEGKPANPLFNLQELRLEQGGYDEATALEIARLLREFVKVFPNLTRLEMDHRRELPGYRSDGGPRVVVESRKRMTGRGWLSVSGRY